MNIIIVEDEGITALFLRESLLDFKHNVIGIFSNASALFDFLKTTEEKTDLIFMDINIEGSQDGIQAAKEVYFNYPVISLVFITSFKDSETIKEAQSVKPLGYLVKPISEVDLETILMVVEANNGTSNLLQEEITLNNYMYKTDTKELYYNNSLIHLSKNEQFCIDILMKNLNSYVSCEQLMQEIWNDDKDRISSLRELFFRLRKKLVNLNIISSPNMGYTLQAVKK